jgi:hypothetical protein
VLGQQLSIKAAGLTEQPGLGIIMLTVRPATREEMQSGFPAEQGTPCLH